MSHRLKVTIKNESDYPLIVVDSAEETVLKAPSILATGSNPLPKSIAPKPSHPPAQPVPDCSFTIETPIDGPTPDGCIILEFQTLQLRVGLSWSDFALTLTDGRFSGIENPYSWTEDRFDGAVGDVSVLIECFDKDKRPVQFADLAALDQKYKQQQKEKVAAGIKNPSNFPVVPMYPMDVVFTVNVRMPATVGTAPTITNVIMPPVAARPTGSSRIITGGQFPTWDTPGLSRRRKKLLAAIGSCFPMHDAPKEGDRERQSRDASKAEPPNAKAPSKSATTYTPNAASNIPYLPLRGWTPGMTSCTMVATMIEGLLTGHQGKWAFTAPFFEDAWVPWGANPTKPMPNVGDVYLVFDDSVESSGRPHLRHVGFILHVPKDVSEKWVTADGGQLGITNRPGEHGGAAYLNIKPWVKRKPIESKNVLADKAAWEKAVNSLLYAKPIVDLEYPYMIGGYESTNAENAGRMIGWIDIDSPSIPFISEEFDGPIEGSRLWRPDSEIQQRVRGLKERDQRCTEADFRFLGAWIDKMLGLDNNLEDWIAHIENPTKNRAPVRHFSTWGQDC